MREKLKNFANALSLLVCGLVLLGWKTQPHWIALGWARQFEVEVHVADDYLEVTTARNTTNNQFENRQTGEFFAFSRGNSQWGNPLMRKWDSGWSHIWPAVWLGHGSNKNPEQSSSWVAANSWLVCLLAIIWPTYWVIRRVQRRWLDKSKKAA